LQKKIFKLVTAFVLIMSLFSATAYAKGKPGSGTTEGPLVALGDSITFGYLLDGTEQRDIVDDQAFPSLMASSLKLKLSNLGIVGLRSDELLVKINDVESGYETEISNAKYISLYIGANDIMQDVYFSETKTLNQAFADMKVNHNLIVEKIREITGAKIVIYNFYNPFHRTTDWLNYHTFELILPGYNAQLEQQGKHYKNVVYADAYSAFSVWDHDTYLISTETHPKDIHPSLKGHNKLAEIGVQALIERKKRR
jgi:lysophospholipase L1-like esterase